MASFQREIANIRLHDPPNKSLKPTLVRPACSGEWEGKLSCYVASDGRAA
jgi:hypothetical protein